MKLLTLVCRGNSLDCAQYEQLNLSVTTYYYYRELHYNQLLSAEKEIVEQTDFYIFNLVVLLMNLRVDEPNRQEFIGYPRFYNGIVRVVEAYTTFAENINNAISHKTNGARRKIAFAKRMQLLLSLRKALHVEGFLQCSCDKLPELKGFEKTIKELKGMKMLLDKFLGFIRSEYSMWCSSEFLEYDEEEMEVENSKGSSKRSRIPLPVRGKNATSPTQSSMRKNKKWRENVLTIITK